MDEEFGPAIAAYRKSIVQLAPELDKISDQFAKAHNKVLDAQRHRAFVERRLWDRALFKIGVRRRYYNSKYTQKDWSPCVFLILENRTAVLERKWKASLVSPRLSEAILDVIRDCELLVRYSSYKLDHIKRNASAESHEGVAFRRELKKSFVHHRELLEFYESQVLPLKTLQLQDFALDGKTGKELRQRASGDARGIRRKWTGSSDLKNIKVDVINGEKTKKHKSDTEDGQYVVHFNRLSRWIRAYTWSYLPQARTDVQALCKACADGDEKEVACLLSRGAYINGTDEDQLTPLNHAIRGQHMDIVRLLISYHVDVNQAVGRTPLLQAVETRKIDFIMLLIEHGANINAQDFHNKEFHGITALHLAGELELPDMTYYLLSNGADCTLTYCDHTADLHKITALHVSRGECARHITTITEYGCDWFRASAKDSRGWLPIYWAFEREDWVAVDFCEPHWSSLKDAADLDGNRMLHLFCKRLLKPPLPAMMRHLVARIVSMDSSRIREPNNQGETPLHILASAYARKLLDEDEEDMEVLNACMKVILETDLHNQAREARPEYYIENRIMYCFGTAPALTDEELTERQRIWQLREAHEAEALVAQTTLFENMVTEAKADIRISEGT